MIVLWLVVGLDVSIVGGGSKIVEVWLDALVVFFVDVVAVSSPPTYVRTD